MPDEQERLRHEGMDLLAGNPLFSQIQGILHDAQGMNTGREELAQKNHDEMLIALTRIAGAAEGIRECLAILVERKNG